ncbi:bromodomain-containing protein 4-like [Littorina saxatilis]|uniref:BZIP domain-containing protein n=1 Tax=Littorina saxatilis TaxID=31220 RepID=A0AAN9BEG7_9CAEN
MTTCSAETFTTHHHTHPSLTFMGSGTGSHSGSGSSSGSNSPPPVKTPHTGSDTDSSSPPPDETQHTGSENGSISPPPVKTQHTGSDNGSSSLPLIKTEPRYADEEETGGFRRQSPAFGAYRHSPPVGLLNNRNLVQDEKLVVATLASLESGDPSNIIKQDLRLIIQSRRKAEGKGELTVDFTTPPKDEQQLTGEELEKRARRRELNRLAAKRSREKGQRRKETLIQEIQGLQNRNGSLEGAMGSLLEERDSLVRTLKGHMPCCKDSLAMTRTAQLLAFSHRLAQLLDWALPHRPSGAPSSPPSDLSLGVELQAPPPVQPPPPPHTPLPPHKSVYPPQSPVSIPYSVFSPPPDLSSPMSARGPIGQESMVGEGDGGVGRDLEIDAAAAAVFREEIERRHHRHPFRVSAPASPSAHPGDAVSASGHPLFSSPRSSPPPPPHSQPITPTHHLPSSSHSLPPHLHSPSRSLPPSHLPSPSHSLPPHLQSPSHSLPPHLQSPSTPFPSHLPSPSNPFPPHLQSPSTPFPPHLPSPSHSRPPPHLSSPTLPFPSHLPSPSTAFHPHLPSPSHSFPSPSTPFPPQFPSPSLPRPSHLSLDMSGGSGVGRESSAGFATPTFTAASPDKPHRPPISPPGSRGGSQGTIKRPQSLDLRGVGIIPKKDPALRSPVIPKKDPALRSPIATTPKKDPAHRSPMTPKKDPAMRSPVIPKKDPAMRSPIIDSSPVLPSASSSTLPSASAFRSSGVFKRGPVQRVASFHGVSGAGPPGLEQVAPLNLSKRRKSEDFGSLVESGSGTHPGDQGGYSGQHTWPPPGVGTWVKRETEEEVAAPLNLVCREQPSATVTSGVLERQEGASHSQQGGYGGVKREGLDVVHDDDDVRLTSASFYPRRLMRFSSYDGAL